MYLASQRKEFILKTLAEHGAARTIALAKQMKVTDETVRNDLINLEKRGFLKRVHGGALALTHKSLLTLKKLPRLDCICRQLPTTLSAQWPVVRWATPTPVWCF